MKQFQGLLASELGTTFDMPDYVPEINALQQQAFAEAQRLGTQGFSFGIEDATGRLLSGQAVGGVPREQQDAYFQAQLAPARREFEDNTLRAIAEQYAGGGLGRSGDFQGALAQAAEGYGLNEGAMLADLVNQNEQRNWEGAQNAAQNQVYGIQAGQYNEMMPINTLMNAGLTEYGLDSERMQMEAQQEIMNREPLANPLVQQWLPFGLSPYKVATAAGDQQHGWQSAVGMLTGQGMLGMLGGMGAGAGQGGGRLY
ncbi:MAG: hypothetical protein A2W26_03485 [Acidobacteria bacterium RBG_16_64_8]|nr:MAG: hypothetical protein A2W26_03485 [Acidobacteria bacterium RBG_16_64_8]